VPIIVPRGIAGPHVDGAARIVIKTIGVAITLMSVLWALSVQQLLGLFITNQQLVLAVLGLSLAAVFLRQPTSNGRRSTFASLFAWCAATLSISTSFFMLWRYGDWGEVAIEILNNTDRAAFVTASAILIVLVCEGLRRTMGLSLLLVFFCLAAYGLFADKFPGVLEGRPKEPMDLIYFLGTDGGALLGAPIIIATTIVVVYILMGQILLKTGGSAFFTDIATAGLGRFRGGSAKVAVLASAFFGSISGSAVSNVVSTGVITIPLMKQGGYQARTAAAIESVASTGGQLMPPIMGAAAFLMAEAIEVSYQEVIVAALIPAVLYYISVFMQADLEAGKTGIEPIPANEIPKASEVIRDGWFLPIPYAVLIVALFNFNRPPEAAALWALACIIPLSALFGYRDIRIKVVDILEAVSRAGVAATDIILITAVAGMIMGLLGGTGLDFAFSEALLYIGTGNFPLLLILTALVCIILGMGMPTTGVYLLLSVLAAPPLIELGVQPMAAHLFVLYFGMLSMITPPVAIAAFTAANLAESNPIQTGFSAVRLGWVAYVVPFLFVLSPALLMEASAAQIAVAFTLSLIGVGVGSCGFVGYFLTNIGPATRVALIAAGLAILVPHTSIAYGFLINILGLGVALLLLGKNSMKQRTNNG
jgi:TRAP transporter 4TM/12TM fusion protein